MDNTVYETIHSSVEEYNQMNDIKIDFKGPQTVLMGEGGSLDSLGLVSFLILIEQKVQDVFSVDITIADDRAMSQKNSPFKTIETLAEYVQKIMP